MTTDTVVVAGAAGGVGVFASQLAVRTGARVIGLASGAQPRLAALARRDPDQRTATGSRPGFATRPRPASTPSSTSSAAPYVDLAFSSSVSTTSRIDTDRRLPGRLAPWRQDRGQHGVGARADVLLELAELAVVSGDLEVPIAATYPLDQVRDAYTRARPRPHPRQDRPHPVSGTLSTGREATRSSPRVRDGARGVRADLRRCLTGRAPAGRRGRCTAARIPTAAVAPDRPRRRLTGQGRPPAAAAARARGCRFAAPGSRCASRG